MILAIFNVVLVILVLVIVISLTQVATKFDWAFGDDPYREKLMYIFLKLLVAGVTVGIIAAIVNILSL